MLFTLALIILGATVVVFFSQEFAGVFKKIFAIPGVKLFMPLAFVSWLIDSFEPWVFWLLLKCKEGLLYLIYQFAEWMPWKKNAVALAQILILFLLPMIAMGILFLWAKFKKMHEPWPYTYDIGVVLWIISFILLTVYRP
ncbi:hypothetical protein [Legionella oakridgensis]|uniref:Uncharacterized protein n=2 Tax=Legionella oakridgensis TaxID=29423 RepID=W0B9A9_9GAMM|nr:hypothetical protein [Legionella oakridgensis]AHE66435.1 hypothetical protein Loa_00867 [Legionella oakridgensis ATCC 33761 = DSM 21215]ETO93789.1 hypothetical protein LOR_72c20550 [Legionella oakridgensis RV-2-2007]KTD36874.1 hypothetical protein Loak_2010 [Legionella oakridgensis]STY19611.1 Uncharacterised protein [Legionella longbeachae]